MSTRKFDDSFHKTLEIGEFELPNQNLDLEIGCGVGLHPILFSQKNPDRNLIAVEHTREKFDKFWRRYLSHESPDNLFPIHANAISFVSSKIEDETLDNIYILYPNPNPLNKHKNKRFHNMPFMESLIKKLRKNGHIIITSNELFYIEEAIDVMVNTWMMKVISKTDLSKLPDFKPRTHFEIKYLKRGEPCIEVIFGLS